MALENRNQILTRIANALERSALEAEIANEQFFALSQDRGAGPLRMAHKEGCARRAELSQDQFRRGGVLAVPLESEGDPDEVEIE